MKLDIIGDIHGCYDELQSLIGKLGYSFESGLPMHKDGRQLAFVGDAMDRGPSSLKTLELMFKLQDNHRLIYSPGNHCNKLYRLSKGSNVQQKNGLETTVAELNALPPKGQKALSRSIQDNSMKLCLYTKIWTTGNLLSHMLEFVKR